MYNENGHLVLENGETKDLCDCLEETCPGCHFQCKKCRSPKCGHECRKNRLWTFDTGMWYSFEEAPWKKGLRCMARQTESIFGQVGTIQKN